EPAADLGAVQPGHHPVQHGQLRGAVPFQHPAGRGAVGGEDDLVAPPRQGHLQHVPVDGVVVGDQDLHESLPPGNGRTPLRAALAHEFRARRKAAPSYHDLKQPGKRQPWNSLSSEGPADRPWWASWLARYVTGRKETMPTLIPAPTRVKGVGNKPK